MSQNLLLNIITFRPSQTQQEFAFYTKKQEGHYAIRWKYLFEIMPEWMEENKQHLYSDFQPPRPGAIIAKVDLTKCIHFAQHYFRFLILSYFKGKADIVFPGFTNDVEIWFQDPAQETPLYKVYNNYSIKLQFARISNAFELVVAFDGTSKVLKKSLQDLVDFPTDQLNWINCNGVLHRYEFMPPEYKQDLTKLFPVVSNTLKPIFNIPFDTPSFDNRYPKYLDRIHWLYDNYINTSGFREIIPHCAKGFLQVPSNKIFRTNRQSNQLQFGSTNNMDNVDINPYIGMKKYGPYKTSPHNKVRLLFIYPIAEKETAVKKFYEYITKGFIATDYYGNDKELFPSLTAYIKQNFQIEKADSIPFSSVDTAVGEIESVLKTKSFKSDIRYLAVYFSPVSKDEVQADKHNIYYRVKEMLLEYDITSQVIFNDNIYCKSFNYFLPNIEVAMLAKLDGVPWRLKRTTFNELIVGIGAFYSTSRKTKYVGSAFCFSNEGKFQEFDCFQYDEIDVLAGAIRKAVMHYVVENEQVERLIIHFYKKISEKELRPIMAMLHKLRLNIPVIVVSINKTESKELLAFDTDNINLMPESGTIVQVGQWDYLLCNNIHYGNGAALKGKDYHFPIKLTFASSHPQLLNNVALIKELIDQVYQFSRMYWKSISQQNLPVTIKYPEMVAEIFPHFQGDTLPPFGRHNLWFL